MNYERDRIVRMLGETHVADNLKELSALYDTVEREGEAFCQAYAIHCPSGCGCCCEHFLPDITNSEARMVAAYLLLVRHDLALVDKIQHNLDKSHCPLYDKDNPFHCTVYSARPLICRLFAQCASSDKKGKAVFRRCKYDSEGTMPLYLSLPDGVPVMEKYGMALRSLSGGDDEVADLDEAVASALSVISMTWHYAGVEISDDDDDSTPSPRAS